MEESMKKKYEEMKLETLSKISELIGEKMDTIVILAVGSESGKGGTFFKGNDAYLSQMLLVAGEKLEEQNPGVVIATIKNRLIEKGIKELEELFY